MKKTIKVIFTVVLAIFSVCFVSAIGMVAYENSQLDDEPEEINIQTIVAGTAFAAQTQTMLFAPPTSTLTQAPTITPTEQPTMRPTMTYVPTFTPMPTSTAFSYVLPPTSPPSAFCSCSRDLYNCTNGSFQNYAQAKSCYDYCIAQGRGDIHGLDGDGDGEICEGGVY